ncbi:uncharacterized protein TNCV_1334921 [Trichonephila clavipes]|nr:uncharacterized protein TNCV_1334921 [Trichonephila clavipes]
MEIPLRTAYGQNGRCGMQPKAKHSLRAQAQLMRTETVETFELVKVKQKLLGIRAEKEREKRTREAPELTLQAKVRTLRYDTFNVPSVPLHSGFSGDIRARTRDSTTPEPSSDEAHFWLNGYVNKQNCRIWSEANPQVYVETSLHPEKLTVWCALWAGGILLQKR